MDRRTSSAMWVERSSPNRVVMTAARSWPGMVEGDGLDLSVEDDAGLLLVGDRAVGVLGLADHGEDDLRLVLLAEPDEPVGLAERGLPDGGLERLLRRGRIGQVLRRELSSGPDVLQGGPVDAGFGEGPPDEIAEVLATFVQGGGEFVEGHGCSRWTSSAPAETGWRMSC